MPNSHVVFASLSTVTDMLHRLRVPTSPPGSVSQAKNINLVDFVVVQELQRAVDTTYHTRSEARFEALSYHLLLVKQVLQVFAGSVGVTWAPYCGSKTVEQLTLPPYVLETHDLLTSVEHWKVWWRL